MINNKIKYFMPFLLIAIAVLISYYWFFMSKDGYNIKICDLKNVAVKGKVTSVRQSKTNVFTVDSIDTLFPMYFEIGYDELHEITNGEIQTLPKVGDSIIKEAKSKFIKFKRGNKIFIAELYLKNCD